MKANDFRESRESISVSAAMRTALSENTRRAYRRGWQRFVAYCNEVGVDSLAATPDDVTEFIARMASAPRSSRATTKKGEPLALGTIKILLAAINRKYRDQRCASPADGPKVRGMLRGLGRLAPDQPRQVKALRDHAIRRMLEHCDGLLRQERHQVKAARGPEQRCPFPLSHRRDRRVDCACAEFSIRAAAAASTLPPVLTSGGTRAGRRCPAPGCRR